MRLGIDFGTSRVVVAASDSGRYPVARFKRVVEQTGASPTSVEGNASSDECDWYPSLCAVRDGVVRSGPAAVAVLHDPSWRIVRSLKRGLARAANNESIAGVPLRELLAAFVRDLRVALHHSSLAVPLEGEIDVALAVPANAHATQRLLTHDAFQQAGFRVVRMLDEPSAAGLEYAWQRPTDAKVRKRHVAVYDLGGGTFDASVVSMGDTWHEVITTEGIERLGGDDFDEALLRLALAQTGRDDEPEHPERDRWLEICRDEKERFTTATRQLKPNLWGKKQPVKIPVAAFEEAVRPLIARSLATLATALDAACLRIGSDVARNTVVYQVGGASQLPSVGRALKEAYGRRVWRSPEAHASVAVGLAIAAERPEENRLRSRLTRTFGVWREGDAGRSARFDPVLPKDTLLQETLEITRRYRAVHNVGHFRFVECSHLCADGSPGGHITPWGEIRFPLRSDLIDAALDNVEVVRLEEGPEIEEHYRCDRDGNIEIELVHLTAGYSQTHRVPVFPSEVPA